MLRTRHAFSLLLWNYFLALIVLGTWDHCGGGCLWTPLCLGASKLAKQLASRGRGLGVPCGSLFKWSVFLPLQGLC